VTQPASAATTSIGSAKGLRLTPISSLDHLVGQHQDRLRDCHAKSPGRLEIADQLERRRLTDRQVSRLRALQDAIDVGRGLPVEILRFRAVADERAERGPPAGVGDRREPILQGEVEELWRQL
jgi:hypothetical protein